MTNQEKLNIATLWIATAKLYDKKLEQDTIKILIEDVSDLKAQDVANALISFRKSTKNKTWPRAADVRAIVCGDFSDDGIAKNTSAKIMASIPHYGYNNGIAAREYIGEFGWDIVKRMGGWGYLCENIGVTLQPTSLAAQIRDLAEQVSKHGSNNIDQKLSKLHLENKHKHLAKNNMLNFNAEKHDNAEISDDSIKRNKTLIAELISKLER